MPFLCRDGAKSERKAARERFVWELPEGSKNVIIGRFYAVVPEGGVEPPSLAALEPKSSASASSATRARRGDFGGVGARAVKGA